uniref:PKD domain-containing protein n=1 Tax=Monopterus albus TaxID=43700 RepID=A0A3Q3KL57_MONAL|nr:transmembrane glycoprotein NMB [Monopterus albus]
MHKRGKPRVHLTSDSPALNGSCITFTAKLAYSPCQKEDANGDLIWDEHCEDANGQVHSGSVYNWTSWLDDYGVGKCTDTTKCHVFPDGKPFPQSNDWRRKKYVYIWHTMGQYYETCDGSSSSVSINTTNIPLGAEVMEVMVYRKRERRKYCPLTTDNTVFYVTDKIPVAVSISQKAAVNQSVFFRGKDVVFKVQLHDPSGYLKTAAAIDYIWDFGDGNQLVTQRSVTTHTYNTLGSMSVKLVVEAAFLVECPTPVTTSAPTSPTPALPTDTPTPPPSTHAVTVKTETTQVPPSTSWSFPSSSPVATTTTLPITEPLPTTADSASTGSSPTTLAWLHTRQLNSNECFRYVYGFFTGNVTIIEPNCTLNSQPNSCIVDVSAVKVANNDISFLVKCLGSIPASACTIVSDPSCTEVRNITCDDVPPSSECEVHLRRTFLEPGTYCVNITLMDSSSTTLARTAVSINKSQNSSVSKTHYIAGVVVSLCAVLVAVSALIASLVYKRYKVYQPIHRSLREDACGHGKVSHMVRLREALFPSSEESTHLLTERQPL